MKISILISELNVRGGTHKQVHRLCEYLIRNGHEVKLITKFYDSAKCYPGVENFNVISFDKFFKETNLIGKINSYVGYLKMARAAITDSDVINIHDNGLAMAQLFIKFISPQKNVVWQINDLHGSFRIGVSKKLNDNTHFRLQRALIKYAAKIAAKITVNVSKNAERVKEFYNKDAEVVYCGVDLRNLSISEPKKKNIQKIKLLSTGIFFRYRNYETLLMVQSLLINKGYNVESTIIGTTSLNKEYADEIKKLAENLKLNCNITGDISEEELIQYYKDADFFLFLNIDQSWGLAVFEAVNLGLPTIVSKSVGATELLVDERTAIMVDPLNVNEIAEKVIHLIDNPDYRSMLTKNGFYSVLDMTWDKMYSSKIEKIFYDLLNKNIK